MRGRSSAATPLYPGTTLPMRFSALRPRLSRPGRLVRRLVTAPALVLTAACGGSETAARPITFPASWALSATEQPVTAQNGMVVSTDEYASQVGVDILKAGGNAVDAAIAVQFALAVVNPEAGNIGGGGFMVLRTAAGENAAIDFREKAPLAATRDMFLDADGNLTDKSVVGHLAAGVPGPVSGLWAPPSADTVQQAGGDDDVPPPPPG